MRTQLPYPRGGGRQPPIFGPFLLWPKRWMHHQDATCYGGRSRLRPHCARCINATWYGGRPRPRRHCVRCGRRSLSKKRAKSPPNFGPCLLWPKMAGWIKMALGMEMGLGPGHIVLDGDPAPFPKKGQSPPPPIFGPFLLWPNGWMHQDCSWYGGSSRLRRLCVRWRPSLPPQKGAEPPIFGPRL